MKTALKTDRETESCYYGRHLLTEDNLVSFPGSKRKNCLSCERFFLQTYPEKFWALLTKNLKFNDSDELWAARCARYVSLLDA